MTIKNNYMSTAKGQVRIKEAYHPFRSQKAKEDYLAFYDAKAERWPIESEERRVETSFGQTFVRIGGPKGGPPLVLLPGDTENSLSWMPQIKAFSEHYETYAIDHIYDNGRSVYSRPLKEPRDFVNWLNELFDALNLKNDINLLGFSYGGWQTSIYALAHPERLNKVVLISPPATVTQPRIGYLLFAIFVHFFPTPFLTKRLVYWERQCLVAQGERGLAIADEMIEELVLAGKCFKRRNTVNPTVIADNDLQKLDVPVLFLVGDKEVIYPARKAVERLNTVSPQVKTVIIPDASHCITHSQTDLVNQNVLDFLQKT